jgi:hypothetical protein
MSKAIYYVSYKLKKGVDISEFLQASKRLNDGYISKREGYVSWEQFVDGETWADMCTFESMEALRKFEEASKTPNELAKDFYSFLNLNCCRGHKYHLEASYGKDAKDGE